MFTQAVANDICLQLAEGMSLRAVCRQDDMPAPSTVVGWVNTSTDFAEQYARAREVGYALLADEIIDISAPPTHTEDTPVMINRARLEIDSRKWLLSKMLPKVYGDKLETTVKGGPANVMLSATDAAL